MRIEMMYNNYLITQLINITEVKIPPIAERKITSLDISGRHGSVFQNVTWGTRQIEVSFYMKYDNIPMSETSGSMFETAVKSLAYYLTSNDAPAQLYFSNNPAIYYLALVESFDLSRVLKLGQGTIVFKCYSPFGYSLNEYAFPATDGLITIENDATAPTYPIFETTLTNTATNLLIISKNGAVQIGNPSDALENDTALNPQSYKDNCATATNWYAGSSTLLWSGRSIDTNVALISNGFHVNLSQQPAGETDSGLYHGGFFLTNLPTQHKYFQAKLYFKLQSRTNYDTNGQANQMGMIDMYLFDQNNVPLTNFSMRDYYPNYQHNIPFWYSGKKQHLWSDKGTLGTIKTATYTQRFESLDDVPANATILADVEVPKYKATTRWNGTIIYKTANEKGAEYTRAQSGLVYQVKTTNYYWTTVYMNSAKTTVGYIRTPKVLVEEDGTEVSVTYSVPTNTMSAGNWNNFAGCVIIERRPHENGTGSVWSMGLYNKEGTDSWGGRILHRYTQTIQDANNTLTDGDALAKVGIFLSSYQDADIPAMCTFDDLVVTEIIDESTLTDEIGYNIIGEAGDVIKVDMGEQMVYKNNEPFMDFVDVGSQFFDIDAFTSTEVRIMTDDDGAETMAYVTKRYL